MQSVAVEVDIRDESGAIIYQDSVNTGFTDDDGRTIKIPLGYLPNIAKAQRGAVRVIFTESGGDIAGASFVDRADDFDAGESTISLSLPE